MGRLCISLLGLPFTQSLSEDLSFENFVALASERATSAYLPASLQNKEFCSYGKEKRKVKKIFTSHLGGNLLSSVFCLDYGIVFKEGSTFRSEMATYLPYFLVGM